MGERGANNEPANAADITGMAALTREALAAGALGISTSRTMLHLAANGEPVPGTFAAEDELAGFARVIAEAGHGVLEVAPAGVGGEDPLGADREIAWMRRVSRDTGCPIRFILAQPQCRSASLARDARSLRR